MRKNKKINAIEIVNKMIESLNEQLLNNDLLEFILSSLNLANNPHFTALATKENEVIIKGKKTTELFSICFEPNIEDFSKIIISTNSNENHKESIMTIDYSDGEHIIITEEIITKLRDNENIILSLCATKKSTIYRYKSLSYYSEYTSRIDMHCNTFHMSTISEELFVEDSWAVKKIVSVNDSNNLGNFSYYESSNYKTIPFDTRDNPVVIKQNQMVESTEETYKDFVDNIKDKKLLELKNRA